MFLELDGKADRSDFLFFTQEPYMEVVNPFILKNKERMIVFLDQLSSITDPTMPPYSEVTNSHLCSDAGKLRIL